MRWPCIIASALHSWVGTCQSQKCPFPWGIWIPSNIWFLGLTRVCCPNGISIGSAVCVQLTPVPYTYRNTDTQITLRATSLCAVCGVKSSRQHRSAACCTLLYSFIFIRVKCRLCFINGNACPVIFFSGVRCRSRLTVVERRSLAGQLSLSCARPVAGGWPLMWVNRPLHVSQLGQLSLSFFRGL